MPEMLRSMSPEDFYWMKLEEFPQLYPDGFQIFSNFHRQEGMITLPSVLGAYCIHFNTFVRRIFFYFL